MTNSSNTNSALRINLNQLLSGFSITQIIGASIRIGIFDFLTSEWRTIKSISDYCGVPEGRLRRIINALVALDLVLIDGNLIKLSPFGELLGINGSARGNAELSSTIYFDAWKALDFSLRTGDSAFKLVHGKTLWEAIETDPAVADAFSRTMRSNSRDVGHELARFLPISSSKTIVDLGAGDGSLLGPILQENSHLKGIAVEQAPMLRGLVESISFYNLGSRYEAVNGDLLKGDFPRAEIMLLKSVLHNWSDDEAIGILKKCASKMLIDDHLFIIERTSPVGSLKLTNIIMDLMMLVLFGSSDRTSIEYIKLLAAAGLSVVNECWTNSGLLVLMARKA